MHSTTDWPHQNCTYGDIRERTPEAIVVFDDPDPHLIQVYQSYGEHLFAVRSVACNRHAAEHFTSVLSACSAFHGGLPFEDRRTRPGLPLPPVPKPADESGNQESRN